MVEGVEEVRVYLDAHGYVTNQMRIPSETATAVDGVRAVMRMDRITMPQRLFKHPRSPLLCCHLVRVSDDIFLLYDPPQRALLPPLPVLAEFFRLTRLLRNLQSPVSQVYLGEPQPTDFQPLTNM